MPKNLGTPGCASTPANANPAPPSFLCPSLAKPRPNPPKGQSPPPKLPPRSIKVRSRVKQALPDKYELQDDGVWRRVDVWTLYGSTVCRVRLSSPSSPLCYNIA